MHKSIWLLLALTLGLASAQANAVVLRYNLRPGDVARYRESVSTATQMTLGTPAQGQQQEMKQTITATYKETVKSVSADRITLVRAREAGKISVSNGPQGQQQQNLPPVQVIIVMTPLGMVISANEYPTNQKSPAAANLDIASEAALSHLPLPKRDVKPGDSWSSQIKLRSFTGSSTPSSVTITSRLLAVAPFRGRNCAKIRSSYSVPINSPLSLAAGAGSSSLGSGQAVAKGKLSGTIVWHFDYKTGQVISAEGPASGNVTSKLSFPGPASKSGQPTKVTIPMTMVIKASTKAALLTEK